MRILFIDRWTTTEAEHFNFYADSTATVGTIVANWVAEGKAMQANLVIDSITTHRILGHLPGNFQGDFRIAGIDIHTDDGIQEIKIDKGESFSKNEHLDPIDLEDPFEIEIRPQRVGIGRGVSYALIPNRIFDWGSSGIMLFKAVPDEWNLPGILQPAQASEDQIQEYLEQKYDDGELNTVYIVGDEVVFLRSNPSGNEAIRAPLSEVYDFSGNNGWGSVQSPPVQIAMRANPETTSDRYLDPDLIAPRSDHFGADISSIFEATRFKEVEATFHTYDEPSPATYLKGDRLASEHFSQTYKSGY